MVEIVTRDGKIRFHWMVEIVTRDGKIRFNLISSFLVLPSNEILVQNKQRLMI
jgi:hypothetical protein